MTTSRVICGKAEQELRALESESVDSMVCDPPAAISFMSKEWDGDRGGRAQWVAYMAGIFREALRVLKGGSHALVWALPRTSHWTATALEDAGFEVRDVITHIFGQGFPKSLDVNKYLKEADLICACSGKIDSYETSDEASPDMSDVLNPLHPKKSASTSKGAVLQQGVLRKMEVGQSVNPATNAEHSTARQDRMDGTRSRTSHSEDERSEQSGMERRGNVLAEERQLPADKIRSMSEGISSDGTQGRLRNGTSFDNGSNGRKVSNARGSRTSQRPQSSKQSTKQFATVPEQSRTQTCGECGKPIIAEGLGTALKPATEHWILCRKPLAENNVAANVLAHSTGVINVVGCRVESGGDYHGLTTRQGLSESRTSKEVRDSPSVFQPASGRFPANLVLSHSPDCERVGDRRVKASKGVRDDAPRTHGGGKGFTAATGEPVGYADAEGNETVAAYECAEGCPVAALDEQSGERGSFLKQDYAGQKGGGGKGIYGAYGGRTTTTYADSGGASRFYNTFEGDRFIYTPKAPNREKWFECRTCARSYRLAHLASHKGHDIFLHPTQKSVALMRWLVRLVTPVGGTVLDPFAGTGTTGVACSREGFGCILVEQDVDAVQIIHERVAGVTDERPPHREPQAEAANDGRGAAARPAQESLF